MEQMQEQFFYRNEKFSITNVCGLITLKYDYLTYKFLFYWLSIQAKKTCLFRNGKSEVNE